MQTESFTFTLGKLDAGMAILLGPNAHLLEFPSLLLPTPGPGQPLLGPGSVLTINVSRDFAAERRNDDAFTHVQKDILSTFTAAPTPPRLRCRNITQTNVVLEWDTLNTGSADVLALEMFKNGQRVGRVEGQKWKTGGLSVDTDYNFHLVLYTTAGTLKSDKCRVRTHTMDNLTGLCVALGPMDDATCNQLRACAREIGAKEGSGIDVTHFVCSSPYRGSAVDADYQDAVKANLPIVSPAWLSTVAAERKLVPISNYTIPAVPLTTTAAPFKRQTPLKRSSLPLSMPGSPVETPIRAPSPETIARMSITSQSDDIKIVARERPRSPRPEADGKLDRTFRFPISSSAESPSAAKQSPPDPASNRSHEASRGTARVDSPTATPTAIAVNGERIAAATADGVNSDNASA